MLGRKYKDGPRIVWYLENVSGSNTITATADPVFPDYYEGVVIAWKQATTNTSSVTININGLGAKSLTKEGANALVSGDIVTNREYIAVYDGTRFQIISGPGTGSGGTGTTATAWARVLADGTKVAGEGVTSVSRSGEGKYAVTLAGTAASSGGYVQMGVTVTPSSVAGEGGDGISPFKAFSSVEVADTDDLLGGGQQFFASDASGANHVYLLGTQNDRIWDHTVSSWTSAANQINPGSTMAASGNPQIGVMSTDGEDIWCSPADGGTQTLRRYNIASATTYDYGDSLDGYAVGAGAGFLLFYNTGTGKIQRYNPSGGTLGAAAKEWTLGSAPQNASIPGCFDGDGNFWWMDNNNLHMIDPDVTATIRDHAVPLIWNTSAAPKYDSLRNRIYCGSGATPGGIFYYRGWSTATNNSGVWNSTSTPFIAFPNATDAYAMYYDARSDILFVSDYGNGMIRRYMAGTGEQIDALYCNTAAGSDVLHTLSTSLCVYYNSDSDPHYGVFHALYSSNAYLIKVIYNGDPIVGFGAGSGAVSSVLVPLYEVISTTVANAYLFRTLQPPVYADGQFTIKIEYTPA